MLDVIYTVHRSNWKVSIYIDGVSLTHSEAASLSLKGVGNSCIYINVDKPCEQFNSVLRMQARLHFLDLTSIKK